MTRYVATINVPGYLPMDDDPPVFDTAAEAWEYLADMRSNDEEWLGDDGEQIPPSDTLERLRESAREAMDRPLTTVGSIGGPTPGYDGDHDLGIIYSVEVAE